MHSERMLIFEPADSKLRKAGIGQYGGFMVGLKRRFHNVLLDADKQMQVGPGGGHGRSSVWNAVGVA